MSGRQAALQRAFILMPRGILFWSLLMLTWQAYLFQYMAPCYYQQSASLLHYNQTFEGQVSQISILLSYMGNTQCGELCHNVEDKKQIQIEVAPRYDPADWNKDEEKTTIPFKIQGSRITKHEDSIHGNTNLPKRQLVEWNDEDKASSAPDWEVPPIEVQMEQNHYIVPHNLVLSRVTDKVQLLLKKEFATSPLTEEQARWYLLNSGNYYNGQLKEQQPFGIGTYLLPGKVFYGEVDDHKPQGMGVIVSDDYVFKGEFQSGKAEGQATIQSQIYTAKGVFKQGEMKSGKIIAKQFVYEGQFSNNLPSGKGIYTNHSTKVCYEGQFFNGKFHGEGVYTCPEYTYKGSFLNGQKDGKGTIQFSSGQIKSKRGIWSQDKLVKVL